MRNSIRQPYFVRGVLVILLGLLAAMAVPQTLPTPNVSINFAGGAAGESNDVSTSLQILAMLTVLSLAPAILILTTAFTRIVIIFSFVRNALGTPTIPPNQVVIGLSLFLTFFVMGPTYDEVNEKALKPLQAKEISMDQAIVAAQAPLKEFMLKNTYEKDLLLFVNLREQAPTTREDVDFLTLVPAFVVSELKTAFIVGFYVFIPFLIIDLIVASALMSMGMMMLPPTIVSLPAKILVFVLADGWATIVAAILAGYR
jgi:flagellar biosynthesis protein FliP